MSPRVFISLFAVVVFSAGCHTMHTVTHSDLEAMYHKGDTQSVMPEIFYCGTADDFDYFVVRVILARDYYCRIKSPVGDLRRMPFTKDKTKWVVYDIDKPIREELMRQWQNDSRTDINEVPKIIWPEKKQ